MRPDFCGLIRLLLPYALVRTAHPKIRQQALLWLMIDRYHMRSLLAYLRYGSLFHASRAIDANGYEISQHYSSAQHQLVVVYILAIPKWSLKLCITLPTNTYHHATPASAFFPGFSWGEREASELLGINFSGKPDARRLMLDYAFEGHPLRKNFPCMGFEELAYNTRERWVSYYPVKYRDEIDF